MTGKNRDNSHLFPYIHKYGRIIITATTYTVLIVNTAATIQCRLPRGQSLHVFYTELTQLCVTFSVRYCPHH